MSATLVRRITALERARRCTCTYSPRTVADFVTMPAKCRHGRWWKLDLTVVTDEDLAEMERLCVEYGAMSNAERQALLADWRRARALEVITDDNTE